MRVWVLQYGRSSLLNHPPLEEAASHPTHRRQDSSSEVQAAIINDARSGVAPSQTPARLLNDNPNISIRHRDVYNLQSRIQNGQLSESLLLHDVAIPPVASISMTTPLVHPPPLRPGDTIAFVAPSSGLAALVPHRLYKAAHELQRLGYRVKIFPSVSRKPQDNVAALVDAHARLGTPLDPELYDAALPCYGSASAQTRAEELMSAFLDPEIKAIVCTIGGLNCHELFEYLDFAAIRAHPKIFSGFSDITSLHLALQSQARLVTFYGPSAICQFGEFPEPMAYTMTHWWKAVASAEPIGAVLPSREWTDDKTANWLTQADTTYRPIMKPNAGYTWLRPGRASGRLIGGCLPVLLNVRGSKYMPALDGAVLLLETSEHNERFDEGMPLHEINMLLGALRVDGTFTRIAGLVVGRVFAHSPENVREIQRLIKYHTRDATFPILYGVDTGHTNPILTLPLGCRVTLDASTDLFSIDEAGVKNAR
ncbi:hypothetical protein PINS_up008467 [Pythium insidiosum]|nr:hypothetical protein PINS_up008467 [Pythium insidiosum]